MEDHRPSENSASETGRDHLFTLNMLDHSQGSYSSTPVDHLHLLKLHSRLDQHQDRYTVTNPVKSSIILSKVDLNIPLNISMVDLSLIHI